MRAGAARKNVQKNLPFGYPMAVTLRWVCAARGEVMSEHDVTTCLQALPKIFSHYSYAFLF